MKTLEDNYISLHEKLVIREIDGINYVLGKKSDIIFTVNNVGNFIIEKLLIDMKATFDELLTAIIYEYNVERSVAEKDLKDFINDLQINGALSNNIN